MTTARSNWFK